MNKGTVGMSIEIISQVISVLPNDVVAVYGMYRSIGKEPIYIGQTTTLKDRLSQHFIYENLSIVTGQNGYSFNPNYIRAFAGGRI